MPSQPNSTQKLQELSLNTAFNSLSMNSSSFGVSIEAPAPRTAKAIIKPSVKRVSQQTDDIKLAKEKLWELFLVVKKSVNSAKVSEIEKNSMKTTIEEINAFITSTKSATTQEIDNYRKKLEEMKQKLSQN
jgi:non-canonical (house-cleaning) NTP pyrophosphatase